MSRTSQFVLSDDAIRELHEMQAVARTVNGGTPADDPRRRVSEQFAEALAVLVDQGATVYQIAKALGVARFAISSRLARHGYSKPAPSVVGTPNETYKGRPHAGVDGTDCQRGHAMNGENLGWTSRGFRYCRTCSRESATRSRATRRERVPRDDAPRRPRPAAGVIGPATTRVLLAVIALYAEHPSVSGRQVALATGFVSRTSAWPHLDRLRNAGLVTWEPGTAHTLRPTVAVVPVPPGGAG